MQDGKDVFFSSGRETFKDLTILAMTEEVLNLKSCEEGRLQREIEVATLPMALSVYSPP